MLGRYFETQKQRGFYGKLTFPENCWPLEFFLCDLGSKLDLEIQNLKPNIYLAVSTGQPGGKEIQKL